jgi:glycosyltransferase involved in cell wall biosynthesis
MTVASLDEPLANARPGSVLIDALAARYGGTAYAVVHIAGELAQRDDIAAVTVITRRGSIVADGLDGNPSVKCVALAGRTRLELPARVAWEALRLPRLVRALGADTVISMSGMLPRALPARLVCALFNPVMYERDSLANRIRRAAVARTVQSASLVVAPSRAMAQLVTTSTRRDCGVAPLGVDHEAFAPGAGAGDELLYVADFYAHKRHDIALDAWALLPTPRPTLRFIGNPDVDPEALTAARERAAGMSHLGRVRFEHRLPLNDLIAAYRAARVFVVPSEHESFCMPLVEAMACGVPAVVRDIASLRETGAGGARYVQGDDPAEWARVLDEALAEDGLEQARRAAVASAARYSWRALAGALVGPATSRDGSGSPA